MFEDLTNIGNIWTSNNVRSVGLIWTSNNVCIVGLIWRLNNVSIVAWAMLDTFEDQIIWTLNHVRIDWFFLILN